MSLQLPFFNETCQQRQNSLNLTFAIPNGQLVFSGDFDGWIHVLDTNFTNIQSFPAHQSEVLGLQVFSGHLVSFSRESLKIWDLNKLDDVDSSLQIPAGIQESVVKSLKCCKTLTVGNLGKNVEITCMAMLENLSHLLIGTNLGHLVSHRGDFTRDRSLKTRILVEPNKSLTEAITNLTWEVEKPTVLLTTPTKTFRLNTSIKEPPKLVEDAGCESTHLFIQTHKSDPIALVARENGIQALGPLGPTTFHPIPNDYGRKQQVLQFKSYLGVVTALESDGSLLTLYDLKNKFVAFCSVFFQDGGMASLLLSLKQENDAMDPLQLATAGKMVESIKLVVSAQHLYVLTPTNLHRLEEKDVSEQLDILYKRHMYPLAIQLVQDNLPLTREIYHRYGDYLYSKGEFSPAIQAYIQTIGSLSPSHVIRKFLDAARLKDLVLYLEALFAKSKAEGVTITKDHTTLLLNCYVRLKDMQKLDKVLTWKDVNFDVETAVQVLKSTFPQHALALTKRYGMHASHLALLFSSDKYQEAMNYLSSCNQQDQQELVQRFGVDFMSKMPRETTRLIISLSENKDPMQYLGLFVGYDEEAIQYLESILQPTSKQTVKPVESSVLEMEEIDKESFDLSPFRRNLNSTLLNLYLDSPTSSQKYSSKIMNLLTTQHYDVDQALIACTAVGFAPGVEWLAEKKGRFRDIVQALMTRGDDEAVYKACMEYGEKDSSVYLMALDYFANKDKWLISLLDWLDEGRLVPPLIILDRLRRHGAKVGSVKEYLKKAMKRGEDAIKEDVTLIDTYKRDTQKMQKQIKELESGVVIFQASKCQACGQGLSLPSIHYYCHHAYHLSCLGDETRDCPRCAPEHRMVLDLVKNLGQGEEEWQRELGEAKNWEERFGVIAAGFSKGLSK